MAEATAKAIGRLEECLGSFGEFVLMLGLILLSHSAGASLVGASLVWESFVGASLAWVPLPEPETRATRRKWRFYHLAESTKRRKLWRVVMKAEPSPLQTQLTFTPTQSLHAHRTLQHNKTPTLHLSYPPHLIKDSTTFDTCKLTPQQHLNHHPTPSTPS